MRKCAVFVLLLIGVLAAPGLLAAAVQAQEAPSTTAPAHSYPAVDLVDSGQHDGTTHIHYLYPPGETGGEATQVSHHEEGPWFRPLIIVAMSAIGAAIGWRMGRRPVKEQISI